jgi:hypothetical protein
MHLRVPAGIGSHETPLDDEVREESTPETA